MEDGMPNWQYRRAWFYTYQETRRLKAAIPHSRLNIDGKEFEDENVSVMLDHLGGEGWELVAVTPWVDSRQGSFAEQVIFSDPVNIVHTK